MKFQMDSDLVERLNDKDEENLIKNFKTSRRGVRFISLHLDCRAREFESHRLDK